MSRIALDTSACPSISIGLRLISIGNSVPSRRRPSSSRPEPIVRTCGSAKNACRWPGCLGRMRTGISCSTVCPSSSARVYPNRRSVCALTMTMRPSRLTMTMASGAASRKLRKRDSPFSRSDTSRSTTTIRISDRRRASSACIRAVMSRLISRISMGSSSEARDIRLSTTTTRPSRHVCRSSPFQMPRWSRAVSHAARPAGKTVCRRSWLFRPIASAAAKPYKVSAPLFQDVICPVRVFVKIASNAWSSNRLSQKCVVACHVKGS